MPGQMGQTTAQIQEEEEEKGGGVLEEEWQEGAGGRLTIDEAEESRRVHEASYGMSLEDQFRRIDDAMLASAAAAAAVSCMSLSLPPYALPVCLDVALHERGVANIVEEEGEEEEEEEKGLENHEKKDEVEKEELDHEVEVRVLARSSMKGEAKRASHRWVALLASSDDASSDDLHEHEVLEAKISSIPSSCRASCTAQASHRLLYAQDRRGHDEEAHHGCRIEMVLPRVPHDDTKLDSQHHLQHDTVHASQKYPSPRHRVAWQEDTEDRAHAHQGRLTSEALTSPHRSPHPCAAAATSECCRSDPEPAASTSEVCTTIGADPRQLIDPREKSVRESCVGISHMYQRVMAYMTMSHGAYI